MVCVVVVVVVTTSSTTLKIELRCYSRSRDRPIGIQRVSKFGNWYVADLPGSCEATRLRLLSGVCNDVTVTGTLGASRSGRVSLDHHHVTPFVLDGAHDGLRSNQRRDSGAHKRTCLTSGSALERLTNFWNRPFGGLVSDSCFMF